ncbi:MAG TPA: ABC transporter permease [Thermomicrobiales bacterium]|jgi:ABC-2 type transport system permease protein|nr:ABC transporter permease [Thermomicrobiales bacterium]
MQAIAAPQRKSQWMTELIGALGFVQRNYYLTKRYFLWELVWLIYTTGNAMSIGFIGVAIDNQTDSNRLTTYLLIGALIWSYLSMLFDILAETVSWERWEGTIEYTFMSPVSRATHLFGTSIYAIAYGIVRTMIIFLVFNIFFDLEITNANYAGALLILAICSISLIGFGMMTAVMPLISPEKGQQVVFIVGSVLLLVSGVYYPIDVLPGWMQQISRFSPVTYALRGIRSTLLEGTPTSQLWSDIWPLLILGAVTVPAGLMIFSAGERFAKRTGRLKRNG